MSSSSFMSSPRSDRVTTGRIREPRWRFYRCAQATCHRKCWISVSRQSVSSGSELIRTKPCPIWGVLLRPQCLSTTWITRCFQNVLKWQEDWASGTQMGQGLLSTKNKQTKKQQFKCSFITQSSSMLHTHTQTPSHAASIVTEHGCDVLHLLLWECPSFAFSTVEHTTFKSRLKKSESRSRYIYIIFSEEVKWKPIPLFKLWFFHWLIVSSV